MKKIILAGALLLGTCTVSLAQSDAKPQAAATVNPQLAFVSKVNEFEAGVMRNHLEVARKVADELMALMRQDVSRNLTNLGTSKDDKVQTEIAKRIQHENELFAAFKEMSADLNKNKMEMVNKAKAFSQDF